jgi:hypothetical protein
MAGRANRTFKPRQICGSGIALEPVRLCPASTSRPPASNTYPAVNEKLAVDRSSLAARLATSWASSGWM